MLASTAARVLSWYYRTREQLDAPVGFQLDHARDLWEIVPSARQRETLLVELSTVGLALSRLPVGTRLLLECRYDPDRGLTDRDLARALHCDREGAREAHTAALVALGTQLVNMGLIHMNGRPTWAAR